MHTSSGKGTRFGVFLKVITRVDTIVRRVRLNHVIHFDII